MSVKLASRYAAALYQAAEEKKALKEVRHDMKKIGKLAGIRQISAYCKRTGLTIKNSEEFINQAFIPYIGNLTARTLQLLVQNGRLAVLPFLAEAYLRHEEKKSKTVRVLIEAAYKPDAGLRTLLAEKLIKRIGKKFFLEIRIIPELLGGIRISWQNRLIDLTLAERFRLFRIFLKSV
ncbi:MAG: ATP synthase F1 subunit delta [Spirochaetes bacterium GWF1_41_5]|nr:MAG: ATP synthase F1 subunit delta [Spirochaetes bacterium GWF1_41_5]HBE03473.1 ATP synthase F1 subunit delta [Spirochaetia bacterium]